MSAFSFGDFGKLDAVSLGKVHAEDAEDPITEERWPYASELYKLYLSLIHI